MKLDYSLLLLILASIGLSKALYGSNFKVKYPWRQRIPLKEDKFWQLYRQERAYRMAHGGSRNEGRSLGDVRGKMGFRLDDLLKHFRLDDILARNAGHAVKILDNIINKALNIQGRWGSRCSWCGSIPTSINEAVNVGAKETASVSKVVAKETVSAAKVVAKETVSAAKLVVKETVSAAKVVAKETVSAAKLVVKEAVSAAKVVAKETVSAAKVVAKETVSIAKEVEKATNMAVIATVKELNDIRNEIKNTAVQVGNTVKDVAISVGSEIKDTALDIVDKLAEFADDVVEYTTRLIEKFGKVVDLLKMFGKDVIQMMLDVGTSPYKVLHNILTYHTQPSGRGIIEEIGKIVNFKNPDFLMGLIQFLIIIVKFIWMDKAECDLSIRMIPNEELSKKMVFYFSKKNAGTFFYESGYKKLREDSSTLLADLQEVFWNHSTSHVHLIIHGYSEDCNKQGFDGFGDDLLGIANEIRKLPGKENVILVDWTIMASRVLLDYYNAVDGTVVAGKVVSEFLIKLEKHGFIKSWSDVHILGFSLGAHVAGIAGDYIYSKTRKKVGRITGLDPARPMFEITTPEGTLEYDTGRQFRLDMDDATFVDVYHCNPAYDSPDSLGIWMAAGDVDIYINSGKGHTTCKNIPHEDISGKMSLISCAHSQCPIYFKRTIRDHFYVAHRMTSSFPSPVETTNDIMESPMGEHISSSERGKYYVITHDEDTELRIPLPDSVTHPLNSSLNARYENILSGLFIETSDYQDYWHY